MVALPMLWIPIVASAIVVFIASAVVWMVLPHHRRDFRQLPHENEVIAALTEGKPAAGQYLVPFVDNPRTMSAEVRELIEQGRSAFLIVRPAGKMAMGKPLFIYFLYTIVVSIFVAYLTGRTNPMGQDYLQVFRVAGTAAILAYGGALVPASIWFARPWSDSLKQLADAVLYGLLTAGVFGWLWPR